MALIGRIILLTVFALFAFASNSLLCRVALGRDAIDPAAFTAVRITSGALVLFLLAAIDRRGGATGASRAGWRSGFLLFAYAICFSFAYVTLTAATGALILFPVVQTTIVVGAIRSGDRPRTV